MRFEGKLVQWNDERGFGFIEPLRGGDKVFVHISAFARGAATRPQVGERLSFEIDTDAKGRKQARRVVNPDALGQSAGVPAQTRRASHRAHRRSEEAPLLGRLVSMLIVLAIVGGLGWKAFQWSAAYGPGQRRAPAPLELAADATSAALAQTFRCDGRQYCSQMTSCAEATYFLRSCPGVKMDGNGDGVPCEQQWCTSAFAK